MFTKFTNQKIEKIHNRKDVLLLRRRLYKDFKKALQENRDYIIVTNPTMEQDKYFRGIGKTRLLMKLATKYDLSILYQTHTAFRHMVALSCLFKTDMPNTIKIDEINLRLLHEKIVIVDETLNLSDIEQIKLHAGNPNLKIIGFCRK